MVVKMIKEYKCKRCKDTGRVDANIPISMIPDISNCNFTDLCPDCNKGKKDQSKYQYIKGYNQGWVKVR